ncbi:hypothetical protein [Paraburkholderia unamae]|uniref:hypothetical protein n=1 Tax=Paraburkholderia unamae TaxID=219649 RepID=UPI0010582FA4|nr:hypothetical protein [Paraburkholderia unamae]
MSVPLARALPLAAACRHSLPFALARVAGRRRISAKAPVRAARTAGAAASAARATPVPGLRPACAGTRPFRWI